jgi:hypothetical protein
MDEAGGSAVLEALIAELGAQGQGNVPVDRRRLTAYPIKGTIDVVALAEAVESALGGVASHDDGKTSAELSAANDG